MGWKLKTALDLLRPDLRTTVMSQQITESLQVNKGSAGAVAAPPGTTVFARNFHPIPAWVPERVEADKGFSAVLRLRDGHQWTRHRDHVWVVPWQPELSELSRDPQANHPDVPSVEPAICLDTAGGASANAPAGAASTIPTTNVSSSELKGPDVSSDSCSGACAMGDTPKPQLVRVETKLCDMCPSNEAELCACSL